MKIGIKKFFFKQKNKTLVIAEVGVNHNSDLKTAKEMVKVAKKAGVDIIKFQLFDSEQEISKFAALAEYQKSQNKNVKYSSQLEMAKSLELTKNEVREMQNYCKKEGVPFLCSIFEKKSLYYLVEDLKETTVKIPSSEITNIPLLKEVGNKGLSVILSTGASNLSEVNDAIAALNSSGCPEILLLHCVSEYPAPHNQMNLKVIETMRKAFDLPVGLSDHTLGIEIGIAAATLGAAVIEKHFTLDRKMVGPDHKASIEPEELSALVKGVRIANQALGSPIKQPQPCEIKNLPLIRKSVVAKNNLRKGTKIQKNMLAIKRPSGGIEPKYYEIILGKTINRDIQKDDFIRWEDLQ